MRQDGASVMTRWLRSHDKPCSPRRLCNQASSECLPSPSMNRPTNCAARLSADFSAAAASRATVGRRACRVVGTFAGWREKADRARAGAGWRLQPGWTGRSPVHITRPMGSPCLRARRERACIFQPTLPGHVRCNRSVQRRAREPRLGLGRRRGPCLAGAGTRDAKGGAQTGGGKTRVVQAPSYDRRGARAGRPLTSLP
jgi:hypothetical protein